MTPWVNPPDGAGLRLDGDAAEAPPEPARPGAATPGVHRAATWGGLRGRMIEPEDEGSPGGGPLRAMDGIKHRLLRHGVVLFTLGILTQFVIYFVINPRMAQSAHTVALMSGMFLILLGFLWDEMDLPRPMHAAAYWLFLYSTYSSWASMFIASIFGTSRNTPFASQGVTGAATSKENIADLAYLSFFVTIVLTCLVAVWGVHRGVLKRRRT